MGNRANHHRGWRFNDVIRNGDCPRVRRARGNNSFRSGLARSQVDQVELQPAVAGMFVVTEVEDAIDLGADGQVHG